VAGMKEEVLNGQRSDLLVDGKLKYSGLIDCGHHVGFSLELLLRVYTAVKDDVSRQSSRPVFPFLIHLLRLQPLKLWCSSYRLICLKLSDLWSSYILFFLE